MVTCSCESGKELTTPCEHINDQFTLTALDASRLRNDDKCYVCAYKEGKKDDWGE